MIADATRKGLLVLAAAILAAAATPALAETLSFKAEIPRARKARHSGKHSGCRLNRR